MKRLSFLVFFLSVNFLFSQIQLKSPDELFKTTIYISSQTPVKNQGQRNTCSAFGIAAALEVLSNMPKDISEKYLYAVQKAKEFSKNVPIEKGQFLKEYISTLNRYGILTETQLPYPKTIPQKWYKTDHELRKVMVEGEVGPVTLLIDYEPKAKKIFISDYEYLDTDASKNVDRIKELLNAGVKAIPVSYELYLPAWNNFSAKRYTTITPDVGYGILMKDGTHVKYSEVKKLVPDIYARIVAKQAVFERTDTRTDIPVYGGHVVTIVGYDEYGFIIKNSWGNTWRFDGYERISYDYHKLLAYEALAIKKVIFKN